MACVYAVMPRRAGHFLGEGGNRGKSIHVTWSEVTQETLSQINVSFCINRKKKSVKTSALTCTSSPHSESFPAKTHPILACPSQAVHDTLPPTPDNHEASGLSCVSLAAQPGSHCPGEPSPWRSRRTRCGTQAGTGNSAGPDAWGAGKSVCLQHRFRNLQPHQT